MARSYKFATASNAQFTVSTTVVNLADKFRLDDNGGDLVKADTINIQVTNGQPIRYFVTGNTPTSSLGFTTGSGFSVTGADAKNINMIKDANATGDATVCVQAGAIVANTDFSAT
jgi:hypothetical protein